jgi:hypothetical protein
LEDGGAAADPSSCVNYRREKVGERFFEEQVRTLDSSRHLGFWTLMEVVGGWWLWFVPDRGEGNNIQSSPKEQNKRKKNVEEKKSNIRI